MDIFDSLARNITDRPSRNSELTPTEYLDKRSVWKPLKKCWGYIISYHIFSYHYRCCKAIIVLGSSTYLKLIQAWLDRTCWFFWVHGGINNPPPNEALNSWWQCPIHRWLSAGYLTCSKTGASFCQKTPWISDFHQQSSKHLNTIARLKFDEQIPKMTKQIFSII